MKIGKKGVSRELVSAFTVPLMIMILLAVYVTFQAQTKTVFVQSIVNESLGTGAGTVYYTNYHAQKNTTTAQLVVHNGTDLCDNYTISYAPNAVATVTINDEVTGALLISYQGYSVSGYTAFDAINTGTQSGFSLAAMLPYVIIALMILALMLKYLGVI